MISSKDVMSFALEAERDASFCEIVRTDLNFDIVTRQDTNAILTHFSRQVSNDLLVVLELDSERTCRKGFKNLSAHFDKHFFYHAPQ